MSIRWSEDQHKAYLASHHDVPPFRTVPTPSPGASATAAANATRAQAHGMNKLEAEYAGVLELRLRAGEIQWYGYECVRLRIAKKAFFTPDFAVITLDGKTEFHETKGHWREAAKVRIKVAADRYPFYRFIALRKVKKRDGGGWQREEFV